MYSWLTLATQPLWLRVRLLRNFRAVVMAFSCSVEDTFPQQPEAGTPI